MDNRSKARTPIGHRLRQLRKTKNLSQGDIESKTGLLRCYISRVENGHTVPSLETLQRFAHGLGVSLYEIFYRENEARAKRGSPKHPARERGPRADVEAFLRRFQELSPRLSPQDQEALLTLAKKLAGRKTEAR
jgi:transcriptional regulator with XRE-family HTH domain